MYWKQDLVEERGRIWTDYVSTCGRWRCGQGYTLKPGETWSLLRMEFSHGKDMVWVSSHPNLGEAKDAAQKATDAL